jgi:hypothetical protein
VISLLNLMARFVFVYRKINNEAPNGPGKMMMMRIVTRNQIDISVIVVVDVVGWRRLYCLCGGCTGV